MSTVKLSNLRRQASEQGYSIWKVHSTTREFWEFGPYALITEDDSSIGLHGVGLEELAAFLDSEAELDQTG